MSTTFQRFAQGIDCHCEMEKARKTLSRTQLAGCHLSTPGARRFWKFPLMLFLHLAYDPSWIVYLTYVDPDERSNTYTFYQIHKDIVWFNFDSLTSIYFFPKSITLSWLTHFKHTLYYIFFLPINHNTSLLFVTIKVNINPRISYILVACMSFQKMFLTKRLENS